MFHLEAKRCEKSNLILEFLTVDSASPRLVLKKP